MKRLVATLMSAVAGFALFAFCGYWMIALTSSNGFDSALEASVMGFLFFGPAGAVIGGIAGFVFSKRKPNQSAD